MAKGREKKYTTISIPRPLYDKLKKVIKGTGFTSVSDYVTFILRELLKTGKPEEEPFTNEDEERIKESLRALGYL